VTGGETVSTLDIPEASSLLGTLRGGNGAPVGYARLRFEPVVRQTNLTNRVLARLPLVDADITTDSQGRFECRTLRDGDYRVLFVDRPGTPAALVTAAQIRSGRLDLRAP